MTDKEIFTLAISLEQITNKRCSGCNDKLAPWESVVCCICEALAEEDN